MNLKLNQTRPQVFAERKKKVTKRRRLEYLQTEVEMRK